MQNYSIQQTHQKKKNCNKSNAHNTINIHESKHHTQTQLESVTYISCPWHLSDNSCQKIKVQRKLCQGIESHGYGSGRIKGEQERLVLVIDDEEMAGAEGNKHGYNRHEERTQPQKKFHWQASAKISSFSPRGQRYGYVKERTTEIDII